MSETQQEYAVERRPAQTVAVVERTVTMAELGGVADEIPALVAWARDQGYEQVGPPFLRYLQVGSMGSGAAMIVQAGVPVSEPVEPGDGIVADVLPAGDYLTTTYVGPYDELREATARLLTHADAEGLRFDTRVLEAGEVWAGRVESYETDPAAEPDPRRRVTRLGFKLAD